MDKISIVIVVIAVLQFLHFTGWSYVWARTYLVS